MAQYTLIASRDPFDSRESSHFVDLASDLRRAGNDVTVFLVQNGVLAARPSQVSDPLTRLSSDGVHVLADSFSLRERAIPSDRLAQGVSASEIDVIVDHLAEGRKVIWH